MPDWALAGLTQPGLPWLMALAGLAGVVYGFAGFGSALIFMPLATIVVAPLLAVAAFAIASLSAIFTVLPQAWRASDRRATLTMLAAALAVLPLGVWVLRTGDPVMLRWAVSAVVLATLAALVTGWRYRQSPGVPAWLAVGGAVGFLGGSVGLNGPAMVLFQLGGSDSVDRTRANAIVVLTVSSAAYGPMIAAQGAFPPEALTFGLAMAAPYGLGALLGRRLFDPARAGLYRRVAYGIIGAAALLGLPLWS
ncbi:sulfite exporter TauE/SafE family protein [Palleronia sp. KMU-117]|uniref:sulfite exporter TauE/SafE family protein n=1 Tax=Palleronia sp. KMU-117 TaxID=3434108 RepID=UPI003D734F54